MNMQKWKKTPICSGCLNNFAVKEIPVGRFGKKLDTTRQPYTLLCGHSFCGECVTNASKSQKTISCLVCLQTNTLPDPGDNMLSKLPVDVYSLGVMWAIRQLSIQAPNQLKMRFIPAGMNTGPIKSKHVENSVICEECVGAAATLLCKQCDFMFCSLCFSKAHKSKALSKHEAQVLMNENSGCRLPTTCQEHLRPIEFFCTDDEQYICSHCIIVGPHKGHGMLTTSEKNELSKEDVQTALPEARKVLKHLKCADKELTAVVPQVEAGSSQTINQISTAFQQLHGILQVREHELISEVMEFFSNENCPVEKLKAEVCEQLNYLKVLIRDAEHATNKLDDNYNLSEILKKLHESCEQPCHLVTLEKKELKENEVKFKLDEAIHEKLKTVGDLSAEAHSRYKLIPLEDLPPEYVDNLPEDESVLSDDVDSVTSSALSTILDSLTDNDSVSDRPSLVRSASIGSKTSSTKQRPGTVFRQELVYVTHIYDPSHFMVQRLAKAKEMDQITKMVNAWCSGGTGTDAERVDSVEKAQFVLAKYSLDNKWYRGQITRVIPHINAEEPSPEDEPDLKVEVKYIDYGNMEELPISRLRKMPSKFLHSPPQSLRCCLYGIIPANQSTVWSVEACHTFGLFAKAKALHMVVMEDSGGVLQVDLRKSGAQDIILNDAPVSIRDALVFLEVACYVTSETNWTEGIRKTRQQQQYYSSELPAKFSTREVMVSHINSPHDFYIQMLGDHARFLSTLMFELQDVYKGQQDDCWTVYCPYKGMPCVAQFEVDKMWYRVRVDDLPGKSMVKVTYVDFGNTAIVSWQSLRKVADKFMRLPFQAIPCSLVDVQPVDLAKGWTKKVSNSFLELVTGKTVKIYVQAVSEKGLAVTLYEVQEDRDICMNALLVSSGLAISTGPNSTILEFPRGEQEPVKDTQADVNLGSPMSCRPTMAALIPPESFLMPIPKTSSSEASPNRKKKQLPKSPSAPKSILSSPRSSHSPNKKVSKTTVADSSSSGPLPSSASAMLASLPTAASTGDCQLPPSIPVTVSFLESPDCFYIQTLLPDTKRIDNFQTELQKVYSNKTEPSNVEWKPKNLCAAKHSKDGKWYRAKILEILEGEKALVQLIDYGYKDTVSFQDLHSLSVSQMKERMFAVCCSLAGIQPAGDPNRWSSIACEYLRDLLQVHEKLFLVKKEDVKRGNLPVDLLYENVECGGALEPTKVTYVSIADKLRDQGLALRKRPLARSTSQSPSVETQEFNLTVEELDLGSPLPACVNTAANATGKDEEMRTVRLKREKKLKKSRHKEHATRISEIPETASNQCMETKSEELAELVVGCSTDITIEGCRPKKLKSRGDAGSCSSSERENVSKTLKSRSHKSKSRERRSHHSDTSTVKESSVSPQRKLHLCSQNEDSSDSSSRNDDSLSLTFSPPSRDVVYKDTEALEENTEPIVNIDTFTTKWKKAELPKVAVFTGIATHVDYGCIIYVQHKQGAHQQVNLIKSAMQTKYADSEPQPHDFYWFPDTSCVAQFPVDKCWYRARVRHVYDDSVEVQFVDYGNTERLKPMQLRKQLIMTNIPIQCYSCELYGLKPVKKEWPEEILSFIHHAIVDKEVTVTLLEPPVPGQNLKISLVMHDGTNLEELLVDMDIAKKVKVKTRVIEQKYNSYEYPYELMKPPGVGETVPIIVTNLNGPEVYIQLVPYSNPTTIAQEEYNAKIMEQNDAFVAMNIALNLENNFVQLKNPQKGDAVCCKYSLDNHWYRGEILEETDSGYYVLFVDYGNQEIIKKDGLCELPAEFRQLPLMALHCCLHQVVADNGQWSSELSGELNIALHEDNQEYFAKIKDHEEPMKIDIYSSGMDNPDAPLILAYQSLIDRGLIQLVRAKTAEEML